MPPPDVVLAVVTAPVPRTVPDDLRELAVPVHDAAGGVVDWELVGLAGDAPRRGAPGVVAAAPAFWAWRRSWERRHVIGPVRELEALGRVVRTVSHGGTTALTEFLDEVCAALSGDTRIGADLIRDADRQLADVRLALEVAGGSGCELVDEMPTRSGEVGPRRPVRTWTVPTEQYLIAATTSTKVTVHPTAGLVVETTEPDSERWSRFADVVQVDMVGDPAVLIDRTGRREELDATSARPLAWLAPASLRWSVRTIALVEVWKPLYEALPRIVASTSPGAVVMARTRVPLG